MSALTIDSIITVPTAGRARTRHLAVVPVPVGVEPAGALRLTRRGRLAITLVVAVLLAAVAVVGARTAWASAPSSAPVTQSVTVLPGQTLWEIASTTTEGDPRDAIIEIRELNGLPDSQVFAGQVLSVPVG